METQPPGADQVARDKSSKGQLGNIGSDNNAIGNNGNGYFDGFD
jgi:hypothetical protein